MSLHNVLTHYIQHKNGISHCTFNPDGPGVVRIHLLPPRFKFFGDKTHIVILNGYYILPIGYSWATLLSFFMAQVNQYHGKPITEDEEKIIFSKTIKKTRHVYPFVSKAELENDLNYILDVLFDIARGYTPDTEIEKLSLRKYANNMKAPHRFDLMVSAMTDEKGLWQCNQKCRFCYAAGQHKSNTKELSTDEWKRVIDTLYKNGTPMVTFTGGEPTIRADLTELVAYAERFITRLNTNGINLSKELCENLKKAGLDSVQVTLYSHDRTIHNDLVGGNHFDETVEGIKNAVNAGLDISVNTPICKKNVDYVKTVDFVRSLGVRFVTCSGLICTGMAESNHESYDLSEDKLFEAVKSAKEYCNSNSMEMDFTSPGLIAKEKLESLNMNVPMCGAALSNMAIAPDGTVVPCQSWLDGTDLGNILTTDFKDIWNHKTCVQLRSMTEDIALNCPFRSRKGEQ